MYIVPIKIQAWLKRVAKLCKSYGTKALKLLEIEPFFCWYEFSFLHVQCHMYVYGGYIGVAYTCITMYMSSSPVESISPWVCFHYSREWSQKNRGTKWLL